ncbi:hypothetical protein HYH03_012256 [Edaphochlamys debaryana]|uniref:Uncharacterized protein n=1 Tax=Edaphochlamys debaryana TaxID=47281 RepID=A0A836BVP8_9CHLO|nr:hypothetical protein HYH03_012256 [Edaphochlamys debaryana]|eukprot:KAG2489234.1 hypothetical protein HYH03_012256 [Edaphochlamys debaryana]
MDHGPAAAQLLKPHDFVLSNGTLPEEQAASARMFSRYGPVYTRPPFLDGDIAPAPPAEAPVVAPPQGPVAY